MITANVTPFNRNRLTKSSVSDHALHVAVPEARVGIGDRSHPGAVPAAVKIIVAVIVDRDLP